MGYEERPEQAPIQQFGGLNTRDGELGLPGSDSPYMVNVDLHPEGSQRKRFGAASLTTPDGETKIEALFYLAQPEAEKSWLYCIAGGKIYRTADPADWAWEECESDPAYELVAQNVWGGENTRYFDGSTEYPSVLFLPRSNGAPLVALGDDDPEADIVPMTAAAYGDGSDGSGSYGYPIDDTFGGVQIYKGWESGHWPRYMRLVGIGKGARMHAWGFDDDPNRVDFSAIDDPGNFMRADMDDASDALQPLVDGGWYYPRPGDGDSVVGIVDMFAYTVVFKKKRTLVYSGDPGDENSWAVAADLPAGCVNPRAWIKVGNDIHFWSLDGVKSMSSVQEYGDLKQGDLSFKISSLLSLVAPAGLDRIRCYHDAQNARVVWLVPIGGGTKNDAAFVYYYNSGKWTKWIGAACEVVDVIVVKAGLSQNEKIIAGTFDAGIVQLQTGYADMGGDVASDYYTHWLQFGSIADADRALWLDVFYGDGGTDVDIYYQTDLNPGWTRIERAIKSFGSSGTVWGTFVWGTAVWGIPGRAHRRFEMSGLFSLIRFRFAKSGQSGFEVMGYRVEVRSKGARA